MRGRESPEAGPEAGQVSWSGAERGAQGDQRARELPASRGPMPPRWRDGGLVEADQSRPRLGALGTCSVLTSQ